MSQQQVTAYFARALGFLVLLAGGFLFYRSMLRMSADSLYYLNLAAQFGLIIMGVLLALRDAWVKRHPNIVLLAFALVGAVAMFAAIRQGQENTREAGEAQRRTDEAQKQAAESNAKLAASMDRLGTQTGEIQRTGDESKRIAGLNTKLQERLLDQSGQLIDSSKRITDLSQQAIDTTTGGDSFLYMFLTPQLSAQGMTPMFFQVGRQPVYDIQVQIVNIEQLNELEKQSKSSGHALPFYNEANFFMSLGNMRVKSSYIPDKYGQIVLTGDSTVHNVNAYFNARNGEWNQQIQLRRVGNAWTQATRVFRFSWGKGILMYQDIPKDFPGAPDWSPLTVKARKSKR